MTQEHAKAKLGKVERKISDYTSKATELTETADFLEDVCDIFAYDALASEKDCHVANRISFYTQHVMDGVEHLRKMCDWYERRIEFEERKQKKLCDFLTRLESEATQAKVTATNTVGIEDEDTENTSPESEKSPDKIVDELNAKLMEKTCGATWHVHTRLQGDRGYRSMRLSNLTVEVDWYEGLGYNFIHRCEVVAHYDTAAQVETVIARIGAIVFFKDTVFNFPHVAELTATNYDEKRWAVDFDVYHTDSGLNEEELRNYTDRLSDALTANGNRAHVELEDCVISIWGDDGGDNDTAKKIIDEMCMRGCWLEESGVDEDTAE